MSNPKPEPSRLSDYLIMTAIAAFFCILMAGFFFFSPRIIATVGCPTESGDNPCATTQTQGQPGAAPEVKQMDEGDVVVLVKSAVQNHDVVSLTFHTGDTSIGIVSHDQPYTSLVGRDTLALLKQFGYEHGDVVKIKTVNTMSGDSQMNLLLFGGGFALLMIVMMVGRGFRGGAGAPGGQSSGTKAGLTNSKAQLAENVETRFKDVAGLKEAKDDLQLIIEFLQNPDKFIKLGAKIPKGLMLVGPPGNGKTLIARAVAGEANVPFFQISGSDFVEVFVGVGAARVRDMLEQAKLKAPCIIFIDEIDAVGRSRSKHGTNDEREQTLNQLLTAMDGFNKEAGSKIIWMSATNQPEVLDPALVRSGRFGRQVFVPNPDITGRAEHFAMELAKLPFVSKQVIEKVMHWAKITPGFAGATLSDAINEAAIFAARRGHSEVTSNDMDDGILRAEMGTENESLARRLSEEEKDRLTVHEWSHTYVGRKVGLQMGRVTTVPRGRSGGHFKPQIRESLTQTERDLKGMIACYMAGRTIEDLVFKDEGLGRSSGCGADLEEANRIARAMVMRAGMSRLGPIFISEEAESRMSWSNPHRAAEIDTEVQRLVEEGDDTARRYLLADFEVFMAGAGELRRKETLLGWEAQDTYDKAIKGELPPWQISNGEPSEHDPEPIPVLPRQQEQRAPVRRGFVDLLRSAVPQGWKGSRVKRALPPAEKLGERSQAAA